MTPTLRALRAAAAVPNLSDAERAIVRSVLYASLFDYPLTLAQLRQTLIESEQTATEILAAYAGSDALRAAIDSQDGFFFPAGRDWLITERRRREARSRRFIASHRLLLALISALPYVRLVALSGSIAHMNLEGSGDLDLFIVTRGRRVWSVTVAIVLLAKLLGRRKTLCANFVVADSALRFEPQDLFSASQIIHLKPLIGRDVYRRLLADNPFVARFYPNFHHADSGALAFHPHRWLGFVKRGVELVCAVPAAAAERLCRTAYRAYLSRRRSTWRSPEQVRLEIDCLKLHTQSHRQSVMDRFEVAVKGTID
jgi:hypothetical protein